MLELLAIFFSISSLVAVIIIYKQVQKKQQMTVESLSARVGNLLSEFNSVSSCNIDLLEDRTEELRRVVELADLKINKLNRLMDRVQGARKKLQFELSKNQRSGTESTNRSRREKVLALSDQGHTVAEIAEQLGLKRGEVDVIIKFNRSRVAGR